MDANCKAVDVSQCYTLGGTNQRQSTVEELISEGLLKIHKQGVMSGEMNLSSSELLFDRSACDQDFLFDYSWHMTAKEPVVTGTKGSPTLPRNDRNLWQGLDAQTMELLQGIFRRELKKGDVGMCRLRPKALAAMSLHTNPDKNLELENIQVASENFTLRQSHSADLNAKNPVASSPKDINYTRKKKEREKTDRHLSFEACQLDFNDNLKENLQHQDWQKIVQLLHVRHQQQMRDVEEMSRLREMEAQLMSEKLKREQQKIAEMTHRHNIWEDMREKLRAKSNNENFARQLKALVEKYERLRKRAEAFKEQLVDERSKRKSFQKTLKKTQQMAEELLENQTLLEGQRDAVMMELNACKKKMATMEEEHKNCGRAVQRVGEESSAMREEYGKLRGLLCKTQEENKQLNQAVQYEVSEKNRAEKKVKDSHKFIKQLSTELDHSKIQRESLHQQLEAMKKELNLVHSKNNEETLQLKEHQKMCIEQFESMRLRCEALHEVVAKFKKEKHVLKEKLACFQKEKLKSDTANRQEVEKLRDTVSLLEKERKLLLDEMGDLRKDYFSLSDRITQRLGQMEESDLPMCMTDISSPQTSNTGLPHPEHC